MFRTLFQNKDIPANVRHSSEEVPTPAFHSSVNRNEINAKDCIINLSLKKDEQEEWKINNISLL